MQPPSPSPSLSTGLQAAGPYPSGPAAIVLICVVIAGGATFGTAAQIVLESLGFGFDSIGADVTTHRAATSHFALAWWAWWLCALGAFLVGPLCAATTRAIVAGCGLMPGLRLLVVAIAVLGLDAVAQLRSFPPANSVAKNSVVSLLLVIGSVVLALLGARLLGCRSRATTFAVDSPGSIAGPATPFRSEGSASSGLPLLSTRRRHQWMHRSSWGARAALVTQLVVFVFAPASVLAGSTVLIHLTPAGTVQAWNQLRVTPTQTASGPPSRLLVQLPTDEGALTVAIVTEAPAVPIRDKSVASRRPDISSAIGHGAALSESELTFTKGYPQRRAAQLAAGMISRPSPPQPTTAADVARKNVLDQSFAHGARMLRPEAESRARTSKHARTHDRYAEFGSVTTRMANTTVGAPLFDRWRAPVKECHFVHEWTSCAPKRPL